MSLVFHRRRFLSVPEAAEQLGVTRLTVYRWIRGTRRTPDGISLVDVIRDTRTGQAYLPERVVQGLARGLHAAQMPKGSKRRRRRR